MAPANNLASVLASAQVLALTLEVALVDLEVASKSVVDQVLVLALAAVLEAHSEVLASAKASEVLQGPSVAA